MTVWLAFLVGGAITYAMRGSFIAFPGRPLPAEVERALRYVGPSAFAAIVLPALVRDDGLAALATPDARIIAAALAGLVGWRWKNIPVMLVAGMVLLWSLDWLGL